MDETRLGFSNSTNTVDRHGVYAIVNYPGSVVPMGPIQKGSDD